MDECESKVSSAGTNNSVGTQVKEDVSRTRFARESRTPLQEDHLAELLDTTLQRPLTADELQLLARLIERLRLDTWKEFTARFAHLMGTRMAVIEGALAILRVHLLEELPTNAGHLEETRTLLEDLAEGIVKAKLVLGNFRSFAAPLELQFDTIDLAEILKITVQEIRHSVDCPIELVLPDVSLNLRGDRSRLSEAFIELARNAQEAMQQDAGKERRITITVSREKPPTEPGTFARIEFVDTGPGVPKECKKRVFEPFFSTKGKGSGLGLAIVNLPGHRPGF
jgi:signal transduction histidine kinase